MGSKGSFRHAVYCTQAEDLCAAGEVFRRQPALEICFALRPFAVEHREPSIVAVSAFRDQVLAERPLIDEAITKRRSAGRRIERVAIPLVAAIAERFEGVSRQQILRLGAKRRALEGW